MALKEKQFQIYRNLEMFEEDYNQIKELEKGLFKNLKKLIELNLSNNEIETLHVGLFSDLKSL